MRMHVWAFMYLVVSGSMNIPLQTKTAAMAINNRLVYLMQLPMPLLKVTMVICRSDLPLPMHAHFQGRK